MELRDLRYFLQTAESGHLGRAADKLGLTQPALTKSIARLEHELNAPLFERTPKGMRLTAFGEHAARTLRQLHTTIDDVKRELLDASKGAVGHLRIGTGLAVAQHLLPAACTRLVEKFPGITIDITTGTGKSLFPMLQEGRIDMVVTGVPLEPEPGLVYERILEDRVVVVARDGHPLHRRRASVRDLAAARWALPTSGSLLANWLKHRFTELGMTPPRPAIQTDSPAILLAIVAESDLLTFHSWPSIHRSPVHTTIRPLRVPALVWRRYVGATYRAGGYLPAAGTQLIRILKDLGSRHAA